jgi:hypothetical protein
MPESEGAAAERVWRAMPADRCRVTTLNTGKEILLDSSYHLDK